MEAAEHVVGNRERNCHGADLPQDSVPLLHAGELSLGDDVNFPQTGDAYYTNNSNDEENYRSLETMTQNSVKATHDEASTPFPIVATASANGNNAHQDEDLNLIPIHADYEDDLTQGQYDAYGGGSTLNF